MSGNKTEREFLVVYDQYADPLFRFCYAQTGQRELAKDIVQETFIRTWKYLTDGKAIWKFRPFLYRTARNLIIDGARRAKEQSLEALQEVGWDTADERTPSPNTSAQVAQAIRLASQLDEPYREAFLMRYIDDMPPREIAHVIGESENVVSVRIHRAMEKLRTLMDL